MLHTQKIVSQIHRHIERAYTGVYYMFYGAGIFHVASKYINDRTEVDKILYPGKDHKHISLVVIQNPSMKQLMSNELVFAVTGVDETMKYITSMQRCVLLCCDNEVHIAGEALLRLKIVLDIVVSINTTLPVRHVSLYSTRKLYIVPHIGDASTARIPFIGRYNYMDAVTDRAMRRIRLAVISTQNVAVPSGDTVVGYTPGETAENTVNRAIAVARNIFVNSDVLIMISIQPREIAQQITSKLRHIGIPDEDISVTLTPGSPYTEREMRQILGLKNIIWEPTITPTKAEEIKAAFESAGNSKTISPTPKVTVTETTKIRIEIDKSITIDKDDVVFNVDSDTEDEKDPTDYEVNLKRIAIARANELVQFYEEHKRLPLVRENKKLYMWLSNYKRIFWGKNIKRREYPAVTELLDKTIPGWNVLKKTSKYVQDP